MWLTDIFDLLLSNIAFVVLIIGGLYSFFRKNATQQKQAEPPVPKKINLPKVEEVKKINSYDSPRTESVQLQTKITTRPDRMEIRERQREAVSTLRNNKKSYEKQSETLLTDAPNNIIQGVIWAEILGPPKSKVPFRKK
jgi:cell division protein FtsN